MMTFSTSWVTLASFRFTFSGTTLLCVVPGRSPTLRLCDGGRATAPLVLVLFPPPGDRTPELEERDRARDRRQPEGERPVGEHGDHREAVVDAEADERADHA